jgi:hypothetical protein
MCIQTMPIHLNTRIHTYSRERETYNAYTHTHTYTCTVIYRVMFLTYNHIPAMVECFHDGFVYLKWTPQHHSIYFHAFFLRIGTLIHLWNVHNPEKNTSSMHSFLWISRTQKKARHQIIRDMQCNAALYFVWRSSKQWRTSAFPSLVYGIWISRQLISCVHWD